tara:strand:- start:276 stop:518 length:243 start_codon:yes stop_codon:yes gene_type:complete
MGSERKGDAILRDFIGKERDGIVWGCLDYPPVIEEIMRRRDSDVYAKHLANACRELLGETAPPCARCGKTWMCQDCSDGS